MSLYIIIGVIISMLLMVYIWIGNLEASDNLKTLMTIAVAITGWMAWPGYLIAGFALWMKRIGEKKKQASA